MSETARKPLRKRLWFRVLVVAAVLLLALGAFIHLACDIIIIPPYVRVKQTPVSFVEGQAEGATLEILDGIPILTLRGSNKQMGRQATLRTNQSWAFNCQGKDLLRRHYIQLEFGKKLVTTVSVNKASPTAAQIKEEMTVDASELLEEGDIDAYIYTVGHPSLSIREAAVSGRKIRLVPVDPPLVEESTRKRAFLTKTKVNTAYYPGLETQEDIYTIGVKAILFTKADTPDATVRAVVNELIDNLGP